MNLTEVYVENFGVLKDYRYQVGSGFNFVYGKNGTGKSTFAEFIKAMFYGLPQTRVRKSLDLDVRKKYKPWDGGNYGGYICFEAGGKSYKLSRTFGDKEKEDTFMLIDVKTGFLSVDYTSDIGEELFGVNRDAFGETTWISAATNRITVNDSIHSNLGKSMNFGEDMKCCDKALTRIEDAYRQYVKTGQRGLIAETKNKVSELEIKRREKEAEAMHFKEDISELEKKSKEAVVKPLEDAWKERLDILDVYFAKGIPDENVLSQNVIEGEVNKRSAFERVNDCKVNLINEKKNRNMILVSAMAALLITIIMLVLKVTVLKTQLWLIFAMLTAGLGYVLYKKITLIKNNEKKQAESQEKYDKVSKDVALMRQELTYVKEYNMLSQKEEAYNRFQKEFAGDVLEHRMSDLVKGHDAAVGEFNAAAKQIEQYRADIAEYERKADILDKTKKYLDMAKTSYVGNYKDNIADRVTAYLRRFDEKLSENVLVDSELVISVMKGALKHDIESFSTGYRNILWFCERLAVIDSMYGDERPPLILDDAFLTFDDDMLDKAMKLLMEISGKCQIIYMTCRSGDKKHIS